MKKEKLIYILPEFNNSLDGHIFYLANFVQEIAKDLNIFLIIEKCNEKEIKLNNLNGFYIQKFSNVFLRSVEMFIVILYKRFFGFKRIYIHYSYIGAIVGSFIMRISFGKTYYWNCGMMWLFGEQPLLKISLKLVNYLVTGVNTLKNGYSNNYGISENKILIMPNWIELERVEKVKKYLNLRDFRKDLGFLENDKIVLFVHRLAERKGIHYISKIAVGLKDNKNIKFLVVGDGPYKEKFLNEIKNCNLENIKYIGKVPNKDIYKYFLISNVFIMPSEEEGFPRVLIESMACNIPYLASDIGGVREISPEFQQKYIYNIGDIDAFKKGILYILNDNFDFTLYVKQFDISNVKKIFMNLIKD